MLHYTYQDVVQLSQITGSQNAIDLHTSFCPSINKEAKRLRTLKAISEPPQSRSRAAINTTSHSQAFPNKVENRNQHLFPT